MYYSVVVSYPGYDWKIDKEIESVAPKAASGSGFGLYNGMRDIDFCYTRKFYAKQLVKKLKKKFGRRKGWKIKLYE